MFEGKVAFRGVAGNRAVVVVPAAERARGYRQRLEPGATERPLRHVRATPSG